MNRLWTLLLDVRVMTAIGLAAAAAFFFLGADVLQIAATWAVVAIAVALLVWAATWMVKQLISRRRGRQLGRALDEQAATAKAGEQDLKVLRERLQSAVKTLKTSRLGQLRGEAALYELPWYMVIGNPAAGKSTAVVKSGLTFPFADDNGSIIQGIGGTRNCDWFFTNEGILLDTAGRYAVHEEDREEWLGFLSLLRRHRPKAPINGIVIAASLAELGAGKPEQAIQLAKNLRQRVQELTERLEVHAPVYLVFTKADLIAGFAEFFEDRDRDERYKVWGATLPYATARVGHAVRLFDQHFDELIAGLRELSLARMASQRGEALPPGVLTFPMEFAALKPALAAFVDTLFEENPYQFQPIFRGFYFTSAVQEGVSTSRASDRIAADFALEPRAAHTTAMVVADQGFFLRDLFARVIFGDRQLVQQYASRSRQRVRMAVLAGGLLLLGAALTAWTWSYVGNEQLLANVQDDLAKVQRLQADRTDLASRLEALLILQDRIESLQRHADDRPWGVGFGLYQGDEVASRLRSEYFAGVRTIMLEPVAHAIESYLTDVNAHADRLQPLASAPRSASPTADRPGQPGPGGRFVNASPEDSGDAYNALKTYLMLADHQYLEGGHLADQLTRFWRGWLDANRGSMPREDMIRHAERVIAFTVANLHDQAFPVVDTRLALVDQTRQNLRQLVQGMKGIERVYADVKARAATRYAAVTVAGLLDERDREAVQGSYAISGVYTHAAWKGYIEDAFKSAATEEMQSADWVLKTSARDDLTLVGSPDQIRKQLTEMYKADYVREWQRFMQGVSYADFASFNQAVARMNRLGDVSDSPIRKLLETLFDETSWDNPSLLNARLGKAQEGFFNWIKQAIMRASPSRAQVNVDVSGGSSEIPMGAIGSEFAALSKVMMSRDSGPAPMDQYLKSLAKLRSRFNEIRNQGDPGPGARQLMAATLQGGESELSETLRLVDEQMLDGMTDSARASLRPLLVRPLIQAMSVIVPPAETEINRVWAAQVYEPFQRSLQGKYPFDPHARIEAGPNEIAKVFGPEGAVAKFTADTLGPMVIRRGDAVVARTWADLGVKIRPDFSAQFANWVAPLEGATASAGTPTAGADPGSGASSGSRLGADQTLFQILPMGSPGIAEYTITIDGQELRYRNGAARWISMVWPNPSGVAGARITATTNDGRAIEVLNEPGRFGLNRLMDAAKARNLGERLNELTWGAGDDRIAVQLRLIRMPGDVSTAQAGEAASEAGAAAALAAGGSRIKGVRLPTLVVGTDAGAGETMASATDRSTEKVR